MRALDEIIIKKANMEAYNKFGEAGEKAEVEKHYDLVRDFNYRVVYDIIDECVGLKDKCVCELGCGTAAHLKWYKQDCKMFVGLDISKGMLILLFKKEGKSRNMELITGDALILPFKNDAFDTATIYWSAHHFPDIYQCIDEMLRIAKGFAFVEPNRLNLIHSLLEWRREKTVRSMKSVRFETETYHSVEYNSLGFNPVELKSYLNNKGGIEIKVRYIFNLPIELSVWTLRRNKTLFRILNLFGQALTRIPILCSQFGDMLIIAQKR